MPGGSYGPGKLAGLLAEAMAKGKTIAGTQPYAVTSYFGAPSATAPRNAFAFSTPGGNGLTRIADSSVGYSAAALRRNAYLTHGGVLITSGEGSPEGVVTGTVGDLYLNTTGGASTTLYVKTSGTGNTGWTAK